MHFKIKYFEWFNFTRFHSKRPGKFRNQECIPTYINKYV